MEGNENPAPPFSRDSSGTDAPQYFDELVGNIRTTYKRRRTLLRLSPATSMGPLVGGFRHEDGTTWSPVMGPGGVTGFLVA